MIFNTVIAGKGGAVPNVIAANSLPNIVVENHIVVITDTPPGTIYIDTDEPLNRVNGDIWLVVEAGGVAGVNFTDVSPYLRNGFTETRQYDGNTWQFLAGYVGVGGTWVRFSTYVPPIGTTLEVCTWEAIGVIGQSGRHRDYFLVGDTKNTSINGVTYSVEIVDFDHDKLADGIENHKAPITFALKNCLNTTYAMNSTNTNIGGWADCALRATLQSTIFDQLESDLQAAIKPVIKQTSGGYVGSYPNVEAVEDTTDTLFLFSEIEVFGTRTYSIAGEGTQYSRFVDSASRIKRVGNSDSIWWQRSSRATYNNYFTCGAANGTVATYLASELHGIAFGFCV